MKFAGPLLLAILIKTHLCYDFEDTLGHLRVQQDVGVQEAAVTGLIQRLLYDKASLFNISVDPGITPPGKDTFKILKTAQTAVVQITGSTGVAVAWGLHHYLKYYCNCHVSWEAVQLKLPQELPAVNITVTSQDRFRYYQNVCTVSYSFVWWNWQRWEKEIDWMALNGINLALAFTGQEAIWQRVYKGLNLTEADINEHFAGPAFLAWNRMGNMRGWGGPLTNPWHSQSLLLQHRILNRMRQLGIIPVLPAFAGHVPRAFKRLYPDANMTLMGGWNRFSDEYCCPYLLDPTSSLFQTVGTAFLRELIAEFGTDHIYNCDTFNEMEPKFNTPEYLTAVSSATYQAMTYVDPKAIWMLQGWLFGNGFWTVERARAYLTGVPTGHIIVLDLQSELTPHYERFESYFGQPFIWCMLHNFGGTLGLYGAVDNVNVGVFHGRTIANSTMVGTGIAPEGINQNYVMYDFMNEMAWRNEPASLQEWFTAYSIRRYGAYDVKADEAWKILSKSVYAFNDTRKVRGKYVICRRPSLRLNPWKSVYNCKTGYHMSGQFVITSAPSLHLKEPMWYNATDVREAWTNILAAASTFPEVDTYQHDIVDITRQALQDLGSGIYSNVVNSYRSKNTEMFRQNSEKFLQILRDLETILATREAFLLGPWLESAKSLATTELEEQLYEYNARNQITLWGPNGEILDYATKQWSGIVSNYYLPRWEMFMAALNNSIHSSLPFDERSFRTTVFKQVEEPFTLDRTPFPVSPQGNPLTVARDIYNRWISEDAGWQAAVSQMVLSLVAPSVTLLP